MSASATSSAAAAVAGARARARASRRAPGPAAVAPPNLNAFAGRRMGKQSGPARLSAPRRRGGRATPLAAAKADGAGEEEIGVASAEELEAALLAEAEAAAAAAEAAADAAAEGAQTASDSAMTAFAQAKERAQQELSADAEDLRASEAPVEASRRVNAVGSDDADAGDGNDTKTKTRDARETPRETKSAVAGVVGVDAANNVLPSDPEGDEIVELTATVRALKLRMSSLAKLLDEAVARRQTLEKELAAERERAEATAEAAGAEAAAAATSLKEATAEVAVLKEQLDETRESLASESGKLVEAEAEVAELTREKEDLAEASEAAQEEARKRLKEATEVRFELQATREMLEATETAKKEIEASLKSVSAETEKRLEARLKAGVDDAAAALAASARREADETTRAAAALLASATEIEAKAREALAKDASESSAIALTRAEKEVAAAIEARDLALESAAATEKRLQNQTELLTRVDALTEETSARAKRVAEQEETIDALTREIESMRETASIAAADAARGLSMAEAAENKIADRVSQTLAAAETCVSTAEKVKKEVERNALAAESVAAQQLEAATARANAAEENLKRSNERLDEVTAIAGRSEALSMKAETQAREIEQKAKLIQDLIEETNIAKDTIAHWEDKATNALVALETKNRELAEATENATSFKVQIASAMSRAAHAEESLRSQTELLDEMAEMAAQKEAAQALVVTLQQEVEAREGEAARLAESARASAEAAATWEAKATAAESLVEARAAAAEAAAGAVRAAAEEKLRVLQEGEGAAYARAEEEAVQAAVNARLAEIESDAEQKIHAATRDAESLRRALAASNQGVELWREKAERAAAELEALFASDDLEARMNDLRGVGGRLTANAFSRGVDLRSFIVRGSPRLEALAEDSVPALDELESVGMGAPLHGRYDLVDAPLRRRELTRAEAKRLAREASAALPTPRWDPSEEAANKERLPFNPRARGLVGKKKRDGSESSGKKGPASPR